MPAIWSCFRAELRGRWRAWLGLAMLIGIAAGVVIASAAGARRTDSAYGRFLHDQRAFDVVVFPEFCPGPGDLAPGEEPYECDLTTVADLPQVADSAFVSALSAQVRTAGGRSLQPGGSADYTGPGEVIVVGSEDGRFGSAINRLRVIEGRLPDPQEPDEVALSQALAERAHVEVGDNLRAALRTASGDSPSSALIRKTWRVVGIEVAPFEIEPPSGNYLASVHVTPAAIRQAREEGVQVEGGPALRLVHGDRDVDALERELDARRIRGSVFLRQADQAESVERAIRPDVASLALVAALAGLAVTAVFGAVLARQAWTEAAGYATLWSLGLRRRELASLTVVRAAAIGLIATPIAALTGFLASPLTPIGLARDAEPDPGFAFDSTVILAGAGLTLLIVVGVVLWPAWRIARVTSTPSRVTAPGTRPSAIATAVARSAFPPPALVGVRMTLEPGRGSTAVPVRTGFVGATAGVMAVAAALAFSASLTHLEETPRLIGFNWDLAAYIGDENRTPVDAEARRIERIPGVAGATPGVFIFQQPFPDRPLLLGPDRAPTSLLVIGPGVVGPSVIEGRAPVAPDEILLGTETLDELGLEIGDTVVAFGQVGESDRADAYQDTSAELRIVGTGAVPPFGDPGTASRLGRGAVMTLGALRRLNPVARPDVVYVRIAEAADAARVRAALRREVDAGRLGGIFSGADDTLEGVLDVERIDELPLILAALVALGAAGVLMHVLITSVRSRRRDLAVLRALGFRRRQVRAVVVWEGLTVAIIALVIGLPVGIVVGRSAWELYAESIGVVPEAVVSWLGVALAAVGALAVALVVAYWPGRVAVRARPAVDLRYE